MTRPVKLLPDEEHLTLEELAERWNNRSDIMGREDQWAMLDGELQKVHWDDKKPEDENYHYVLIDGKLHYPIRPTE